MKIIVVLNDTTGTVEYVLPTRDLSSDELSEISHLLHHWHGRTVHYTDMEGSARPFPEIVQTLKDYMSGVEKEEARTTSDVLRRDRPAA